MFATRHAEVAGAVAKLRAFGVDRRHDQRSVPGMYDVPTLGLNYRMSEMQAALGESQLSRIDEILERRKPNFEQLKEIATYYTGTLPDSQRDGDIYNGATLNIVMFEPATMRLEVFFKPRNTGQLPAIPTFEKIAIDFE